MNCLRSLAYQNRLKLKAKNKIKNVHRLKQTKQTFQNYKKKQNFQNLNSMKVYGNKMRKNSLKNRKKVAKDASKMN